MKKKNIVETIRKNIAQTRILRGMTQTDLARKMGISQRLVAYYEAKATSLPIEKVQGFADALDTTILELMNEQMKKPVEFEEIDIRLLKKLKAINDLPRRAKDSLINTINVTLESAKLKAGKKATKVKEN